MLACNTCICFESMRQQAPLWEAEEEGEGGEGRRERGREGHIVLVFFEYQASNKTPLQQCISTKDCLAQTLACRWRTSSRNAIACSATLATASSTSTSRRLGPRPGCMWGAATWCVPHRFQIALMAVVLVPLSLK